MDAYLESTVYNGFSTDIKNALNLMSAQYGNSSDDNGTIQRHVIAPSTVELGVNAEYGVQLGTIYPIFSPAAYANTKSIYKTPSGDAVYYWTRTVHGDLGTSYVIAISRWGDGSNVGYSDSFYAIARIRFAKA